MNKEKLKNIIEAALMVSDKPLSISRLLSLFERDLEQPDRTEIRSALDDLNKEYEGHGVELKEVASGFRIQVCNEYAEWVNRLYDERPPRYSRALLETRSYPFFYLTTGSNTDLCKQFLDTFR